MTIQEILLFVGLGAVILLTQVGRHAVGPRNFLLPFVIVAVVVKNYMTSVPTVGGDVDFYLLCMAIGIGFGLLASAVMRVERDALTGKVMTVAGLGYAAVWFVVIGGRLAFAYAATHVLHHQVAQFSYQHLITGGAAWTAAFIFMTVAMIGTRTAILAAKVALATRRSELQPA